MFYLCIFLYFEHKKDKPQTSATKFFKILIITNYAHKLLQSYFL